MGDVMMQFGFVIGFLLTVLLINVLFARFPDALRRWIDGLFRGPQE